MKSLYKLFSSFLIILLVITFYFKGDTLYWNTEGYNDPAVQFLQLQLNKAIPPNMNEDPIEYIEKLGKDKLVIFTKDKYWILHYAGNPIQDWYVEDYKNI